MAVGGSVYFHSQQNPVSVSLSPPGSQGSVYQPSLPPTKAHNLRTVWTRVCSFLGISAQRYQLAGSDWFLHLPLVLLGLRTVPKDDTDLSVSEAVYGSPLTILGELLRSPKLPSASFLWNIENAVAGFAISPPHHVRHSPPLQLPPALLTAALFLFMRMLPFHHLLPWTVDHILFWRKEINSCTSSLAPERMMSLWTV